MKKRYPKHLYHELFAKFLEKWFSDGELETLISDTAEMIRPYVEKDPTKFCTTEEFDKGISAIRQFVTLRAEAVGRQLNGNTTAVDTGSLNLSDMGTMGGSFGGGNMPGGDRNFDFSSMSERSENGKMSRTESEGTDESRSEPPADVSTQESPDGEETDSSFNVPTQENNGDKKRDADGFDSSSFGRGDGQSRSRPDGNDDNTDFSSFGGASFGNSAASSAGKWIWVGISAVVLAGGLFIAWKKK